MKPDGCYDSQRMRDLDAILEHAAARPRRIVFAESDDPRVREAAETLARRRICEPLLLDTGNARQAAVSRSIEWVGGLADDAAIGASLDEAWAGRAIDPAERASRAREPLHRAAALVRAGLADGCVAGAVHATSDVIRAALRVIRPEPGVRLVSSFFLMELPQPSAAGDRVIAFADCGLVPRPDADELAQIGRSAAGQFRRLVGAEPRVAFLSFSTRGSADHEEVQRVREAARRCAEAADAPLCDGELQVDAALVPEVAASKAPDSPVAGRANVLIFPDLNSGNIGYKLVERLAGARAVGPILQGLARPANDLSRGCSAEDIVFAAAVTALQAE